MRALLRFILMGLAVGVLLLLSPRNHALSQGEDQVCGKFEVFVAPIGLGRFYYFFTPYGSTEQWVVEPILTDASGQEVNLESLDGKNVRFRGPVFSEFCEFPNSKCLARVVSYEVVSTCEPPSTPTLPPVPTRTPSPTFTPTPLPIPTSTPTPSPTPTPTPAVDVNEASTLLDTKRSLILQMEDVDIPTDLFPVVGVQAYNETEARNLLGYFDDLLELGLMTPEQLEALERWVLQEEVLSEILVDYTEVAATVTDVSADSIKTGMGMLFVSRPAWQTCARKAPFCGKLQRNVEKKMWSLLRNSGKLLARFTGPPEQREATVKVWDLMMRLVEQKFSEGEPLMDLLVDNSVQAAGTALMIQPYLTRSQEWIDKGVRTADVESGADDRWEITGTTEQAKLLLDGIVLKSGWAADDALSRHQDFEKATNLADVAEDVSDLAALSPLALMAKVVGVGVRLERLFIVNLPQIYANAKNMGCIEYLGMRAAEMAFDAAQPVEDCRYRESTIPSGNAGAVLVSYQSASAEQRLRSQLQGTTDEYRQALQALTQAAERGDLDAIVQSADRLMQADAEMENTLEAMQAVLLEHETLSERDLAFLSQMNAFSAANLVLYFAVAETLMAQQEGQEPQIALSKMAQSVLARLNDVEESAALADLTVPAGISVLMIRDVAARLTPEGQLEVAVTVSNIGTEDAQNVVVNLLMEGTKQEVQADIDAIAAGADADATLRLSPPPSASVFTVQLWSHDALVDFRTESIPLESVGATELTESIPAATPTVSQTTRARSQMLGGGWFWGVLLVAAVWSVAVFWFLARRKSGR